MPDRHIGVLVILAGVADAVAYGLRLAPHARHGKGCKHGIVEPGGGRKIAYADGNMIEHRGAAWMVGPSLRGSPELRVEFALGITLGHVGDRDHTFDLACLPGRVEFL